MNTYPQHNSNTATFVQPAAAGGGGMDLDPPQVSKNPTPSKPSREKPKVRRSAKKTTVGFKVPAMPPGKAQALCRHGVNHGGKGILSMHFDYFTHAMVPYQGLASPNSDSRRHLTGAGSNSITPQRRVQVSQNQLQDPIAVARAGMVLPTPFSDRPVTSVVGMEIPIGNGCQDFYTADTTPFSRGYGDGPPSELSPQSTSLEQDFERVTLAETQYVSHFALSTEMLTMNALHRESLEWLEEQRYDCTCAECLNLDFPCECELDHIGTCGEQQSSTDNAQATQLGMSSATSTDCCPPYITATTVPHSIYNAHVYGAPLYPSASSSTSSGGSAMQPISDMVLRDFLFPKDS
ncbi:hypothetical protein FRC02_004853 [Tulasnella sp. 418]|nr:hypothetical protein FRC02_004853 [Tulasnella sp. 418]